MRRVCGGNCGSLLVWWASAHLILATCLGLAGCANKEMNAGNDRTSGSGGTVNAGSGGKADTNATGGSTATMSGGGGAADNSGGTTTSQSGGNAMSGGGSDGTGGTPMATSDGAVVEPETTVFRITTLALRDPHMLLTGTDITDTPFLGVSVNGAMINNGFTMDYDMDGFVDSSFMLFVTPGDSGLDGGRLQMIDGLCDLNDTTQCQPDPTPSLDGTWTIDEYTDQTCLEAIPGSTSGYSPAVAPTEAPCFVGHETRALAVNVGGIVIDLTDARISARLEQGSPPRLVDGLLIGFVTESAAAAAVIPSYIPLLAGMPLTSFIPTEDFDPDTKPGNENGYWLYMNFEADTVDYQSP